MDLLVTNIGLLATPQGSVAKQGTAMGDITFIKDAAVAVRGSKVAWVGLAAEAPQADRVVDARCSLVTPGLVDCHNHLVFDGWRQHDILKKVAGVPHLEIQMRDDGVRHTVEKTRAADFDSLYRSSMDCLREMVSFGVTLTEAKSGYGLGLEEELKLLRVIRQLNANGPVEVVPTLLSADFLPPEFFEDREAYLDLMCNELIPQVAQQRMAEFCDVFCDVGAFTAAEAERMLETAKAHGFNLKIHADKLEPIGGSVLAAKVGVVSADHLIATPLHAMHEMAAAGVIGVVLPASSHFMNKPFARVYEMQKANMAVAVASGFNPGSAPCSNLQVAMHLACLKCRMAPAEILCAVTLNAAAALGQSTRHGSIEPGKLANLLIWDAEDLNTIFYRFGGNLVRTVIVNGKEADLRPRA